METTPQDKCFRDYLLRGGVEGKFFFREETAYKEESNRNFKALYHVLRIYQPEDRDATYAEVETVFLTGQNEGISTMERLPFNFILDHREARKEEIELARNKSKLVGLLTQHFSLAQSFNHL